MVNHGVRGYGRRASYACSSWEPHHLVRGGGVRRPRVEGTVSDTIRGSRCAAV